MNGKLKLGAVLHYRDFPFEDGTKRNKYLVVLGAKPECDYLCVLTTSKQWRMNAGRGCHHQPNTHFFVPGGGKNFFPIDTWLQLARPIIVSQVDMLQKGLEKAIQTQGNLNQNITGEIRNCLKASRDISKNQIQLL